MNKDTIEQILIKVLTVQQLAAVLEGRIDELVAVQLEHGRYITQTWVGGKAMTIEARLAELKAQRTAQQGGKA